MKKNFVNYCSLFINEYTVDLQRNRGYLSEKARIKAIEFIDTVLTKGVVTPANLLWRIQQPDEPEEVISILWLLITGPSAWISDFYIYPDWRGRGFGGLALCEIKRLLKIMDINEVGLRVAPNNTSAKALYQKNYRHQYV